MTPENLARAYGTPLYIYDRAEIRRAHAELVSWLPSPARLYFSAKSNPHPDVASVLARLGCHVEVSSSGELSAAARAGFAADRVLVTGPGKTSEMLSAAAAQDVRRFSAESPADLGRIGVTARRGGVVADCLLRINADRSIGGMSLAMTGSASQFGVDASWVADNLRRVRVPGTRITGLHLYMGSNIEQPQRLMDQFRTSVGIAAELRGRLPLSEVDLGGGFAAPFARTGHRSAYPELSDRLGDLLDALLPGWRGGDPLVSFESGRYLVATCGTLLCSVLDVKRSKGRTFVVLDAGVHHLGGMSALRRLPRVVPDLVTTSPRRLVDDCVVAGPLCTPLDVWSNGVRLPELAVGDLVTVPNVGAYGITASLVAFLGHPPATEVVVDGDVVVSASRLTIDRTDVARTAEDGTAVEGALL